MLHVRTAAPADADRLVLRPEDLEEARLYGETPAAGLRRSIAESSQAYAALDETGVVALWGFADLSTRLSPWLMCSERVTAHSRDVLRLARAFVGFLRSQKRPVWNLVGIDSLGNKRFLRRLGFRVEPLCDPSFDRFYLP